MILCILALGIQHIRLLLEVEAKPQEEVVKPLEAEVKLLEAEAKLLVVEANNRRKQYLYPHSYHNCHNIHTQRSCHTRIGTDNNLNHYILEQVEVVVAVAVECLHRTEHILVECKEYSIQMVAVLQFHN